jgi:ElaB/YqjD/DUF883 family membrane-anchored ribosome-binding protein
MPIRKEGVHEGRLQEQQSSMPLREEGFHGGSASEDNNELQDAPFGSPTGASSAGNPGQQYNQQIADAASQARDYLSDKASRGGDKIRDLRAVDYTQVIERVKEHARQKPGQSLLISASAGLVIGLLLRSPRRK